MARADLPPRAGSAKPARPILRVPGFCTLTCAAIALSCAHSLALGADRHDRAQSRTALQRMAQARPDAPRLAVVPNIVAAPASRIRLQIMIQRVEAVPPHSFVRLRGLPPLALLSDGHAISPGAWAVPLASLNDLDMTLPADVSGAYDVTVSLVAEDGTVVAQAATKLVISAKPGATPKLSADRQPVALTPADREAAEKLIARGERDMQGGNVAQARQFFLRAAEAGLPRGALLLGSTYDPQELARLGVRSVQPNPALARKWYERARDLGDTEADERLANLGGG
jgi:hypothetical protein